MYPDGYHFVPRQVGFIRGWSGSLARAESTRQEADPVTVSNDSKAAGLGVLGRLGRHDSIRNPMG